MHIPASAPRLESLAPLTTHRVVLPRHKDYKIEQQGIFTVATRTGALRYNNAVYAVCFRWVKAAKTWMPLLARFIKFAAGQNPARFAVYVLGRLVAALLDMASLWTDTRLESMVEQAVRTRVVQQANMLVYAISNIVSNGYRTRIENFFTTNEGILSASFDLAVRKKLMEARAKLDIHSMSDSVISSAFAEANRIQALDVSGHVVALFSGVLSAWGQVKLYRSLVKSKRTTNLVSITAFAFSASILQYFRWFIQPPGAERSRATHPAFQRLNELWSLSCQAEDPNSSADIKLLSLSGYLAHQFELARMQLGDLPFIRNRGRIFAQTCLDLSAHAWPVILRCMFILHAVRDPSSAGSLAQISITAMCARKIASTLSGVVSAIDDIRIDCSKVRAFYQVLDVQSQIAEPPSPVRYRTLSGFCGKGMKIEFRNVSFGYYGKDGPLALRDLSFIIPAGALVCCVGGNGAGKSTLIKLLTRLYDPTSGEILVNDVPIKSYSSDELHAHMAVQLQHCPVSRLTIAEFIGLGRAAQSPTESVDEVRVMDALRRADALHIVERLDKAIWARLGPFPPRPTPKSLLAEALYVDEAMEDEWTSDEKLAPIPAPAAKANGKRNTTYSCSFSGGEWAKICFARSLMKDADFRIFDEPAAALDALAAQTIFRGIEELRGEQTIVHVTHQLRSAVDADLILCLKDGQLVEQGTHYDLIQKDGFYRSLAAVQMPEALMSDSSGINTPSETGSSDSGFFNIIEDKQA